jgi:hypothetical protein
MLTIHAAFQQITKFGEEICGDRVEIQSDGQGGKIVVVSDGLGSGVKANILSSLTTKIISTMLREGCSIDEVAETLNDTLPVCKVRQVAYSTFTTLRIDKDGSVTAAEYDNPNLIWISDHKLRGIPRKETVYGEKMKIAHSSFKLRENDWLIVISDGVVHAGIGRTWDLGWTWERVAAYIKNFLTPSTTPEEVCDEVLKLCRKLYAEEPGDDATVVAMQLHHKKPLTIMIGPPRNAEADNQVIQRLLQTDGRKIACGGTTGNIIARHLGKEITVLMETAGDAIPPIGLLEGVDLLTEGVLTLAGVVELLRNQCSIVDVKYKIDGASEVFKELLRADEIRILLGQAINPAHQNPNTPVHLGLKFHMVEEMQYLLQQRGKIVIVEKF